METKEGYKGTWVGGIHEPFIKDYRYHEFAVPKGDGIMLIFTIHANFRSLEEANK